MNEFTKSLVARVDSSTKFLIHSIGATHGFAVDAGGKMIHQWRETCGPEFGEWLYSSLQAGRVRLVKDALDQSHKKKLWNDCGFPKQRWEIKYVEVGVVATRHYLVSEDCDFWEPRHKGAKCRAKTMEKRSGKVCKYLKAILGVSVGRVEQCIADFGFQNLERDGVGASQVMASADDPADSSRPMADTPEVV